MTILTEIAARKRTLEIPQRLVDFPFARIRQAAEEAPPALDFPSALRLLDRVALIAEIKKASPSKGLLCPDFNPIRLAEQYVSAGASAISVITDEHYFQGHLDYLKQVRRAFPTMPILRKDFIIHPYQIYEARAAGADAVLLIAAILDDAVLKSMFQLVHDLGMTSLLETHDRLDLQRVVSLSPELLGVNNRNLNDFSVDLNTCLMLRPLVPASTVFVAESGIHTSDHIRQLQAARVDAALIGEALVTSSEPGEKLKEFVNACSN